jgi:transcriptional regulator with PAS, ATPase and Fis domain
MVVTAVRDIEAQLRHIEILHSLELSDNYKNTIIDSISEGLLAVDEKGLVTHVNDTAALSTGGHKAKMVGRYLWQLIPAKKNKTLFNLLKKRESVTDYELNFFTNRTKIGCLYTSRPIKIEKKSVGTVMLFSKVERARRLVLRMSGGEARFRFSDIIGQDPRFLETIEVAKKSAGSQSNMLILGESGSGKDILAQAIHNASSQRSGPFIAVNCCSIPRELIASEMFGYAGGAFTDASRGGKPGKLELADGGTLFLDEIGEMPLELQTLLLRSLETRTITRLGDNASIPINVRIIAATNKDLYAEVFKKNFRRDLFYRLNVITIHMPPLRERKGDIVPLANHFLALLSKTMRKNHVKRIDPKVMCIFSNHHWPGNIRELQNVIERALNVCTESAICLDCLPPELRNNNTSRLGKPVDYYERELIQTLMDKNDKNISKVAKEIGLSRTTLYRKIVKYNL